MSSFREFILRLNFYDCVGYTLLQKSGISVQRLGEGKSSKDTREISRNCNFKVFYETKILTGRRAIGLFKRAVLNSCHNLIYSTEAVKCSAEKNLKDVFISSSLGEKEILVGQDLSFNAFHTAYHNGSEVMISSQQEKELEDEEEVNACKSIFIYLALEGNVICLIRGHTLAAMNELKMIGGIPVKVLDFQVYGPIKDVATPCKAITSNSQMIVILANVTNGERVRCEVISKGLSYELKDVDLSINGNTVDEAKLLITTRGMKIVAIDSPDEDAILAVRLSTIVDLALEYNYMITFN